MADECPQEKDESRATTLKVNAGESNEREHEREHATETETGKRVRPSELVRLALALTPLAKPPLGRGGATLAPPPERSRPPRSEIEAEGQAAIGRANPISNHRALPSALSPRAERGRILRDGRQLF